MRIRTVKPEFWTDEKVARLSEPTVMLAIGLLNYADDDGYFNANEALLRAAIFPIREPSLSITRMVSELVDIGYIRLGQTKDGRRIGIVVHFKDHQKVSHPVPSKLKHLVHFNEDDRIVPIDVTEASLRKTGEVQEASSLKGKERNREGKGEDLFAPASETRKDITDDEHLAWLKLKRAWTKEPSDRLAWLTLLREHGPKAVDTAMEQLRRLNPARKYVDAGEVQSLIQAGRQAIAEPEPTKPPELMSLVEGIAQEPDPDRKRDLTRVLEAINARGWTAIRDLLGWKTATRQRLESAFLLNPAAASGLLEIIARADSKAE